LRPASMPSWPILLPWFYLLVRRGGQASVEPLHDFRLADRANHAVLFFAVLEHNQVGIASM
ncbi:MAG TPA: hypothetical protein VGK65_13100, partial [Candidatus Binatia bacterium]